MVKNGPSAGKEKLVFDFHVGLDDELVSVWETTVLRSKFREELRARRKPDFEPGERMTITPTGKKESANGVYRDFDITFEHAAPKRSAAELLEDDRRVGGGGGDDGDPFPKPRKAVDFALKLATKAEKRQPDRRRRAARHRCSREKPRTIEGQLGLLHESTEGGAR